MGRQPFLTRLALGRSPFEPSNSISQSSEYVQLDASQQDLPPTTHELVANRYIQLYDERGAPINPKAHEHGRMFRQAQNDVLSAIGVVERHPSPSQHLPGAYRDRLEQLENEDSAGNAVALASTLAENLCTWWIGSLRDRILTFRIRHDVTFSEIIAFQYHLAGRRLIYAGFPARLLSTVTVQASAYAVYLLRPLDHILFATKATRKTRQFFQRWKNVTSTCFRLLAEAVFYPFAYHANLQRLGLLPPRPLFPSWRAFIPFSPWSPIRPLSIRSGLSTATIFGLGKAVLTSPLLFVCLEHSLERWVYGIIYEAVASSTIHPDNPDLLSPDDGVKHKETAILGLRQKSPPFIRNAINRALATLGWAETFSPKAGEEQRRGSSQSIAMDISRTIDVGDNQVTNLTSLPVEAVHTSMQPVSGLADEANVPAPSDARPDRPPASPTASEPSQNDDDPRIRITSREGIVEMEVRLPPEVLQSYTEMAGSGPPISGQRNDTPPAPVEPVGQKHHRVTQLSTEPAQMIGAICKAQIVGWAVLPLKIVTFRLIASHYLAGRENQAILSHWRLHHVLDPMAELRELNIRSVGQLFSRVALCGALEIAIDLTLWGCQWVAVTYIGKKSFGWGVL